MGAIFVLSKEINMIPSIDNPSIATHIDYIDEELIIIHDSDRIVVDLQYPKMNFKNCTDKCYLRKEVYHKLIEASKKLPDGYKIKIYDTWRSFEFQKELYDYYYDLIVKKLKLQFAPKEQIERIVAKYVSPPSKKEQFTPVHTTGGAIDLTIIDANGKELSMGTDFDEFSQMAQTDYFEKQPQCNQFEKIKENRRKLYEIMTSSGFTNLPSEWWHYDYGDRFWSFYTQSPVKYRGIFKEEEINEKQK